MKSKLFLSVICLILLLFISCKKNAVIPEEIERTPAGGTRITYIKSDVGNIAVRLELPDTTRYTEGAPLVVHASTFFAPFTGFHRAFNMTDIGMISVSYLRPGREDPVTGARSEGSPDHDGTGSLAALRDVIRFAYGELSNTDGYFIGELLDIVPITLNVGIFASSHSGIVATNVTSSHGDVLHGLKYLVGRENPTRDEMYPLEIGHYLDDSGGRTAVQNPHCRAENYTSTTVDVDYSTVDWIMDGDSPQGRPFFKDGHGTADHYLHPTICPTMWDKRYYSRGLLQGLLDNGVFTLGNWPDDLATPQEAIDAWPSRTTVNHYPVIGVKHPNLKVMLVFAKADHVQAAPDKPHIHQAYDGFKETAGLWVRLNCDLAYVQSINPAYGAGFPDNDANTEPSDWNNSVNWAYPANTFDMKLAGCQAAVAEMADRVQGDDWSDNLDGVIDQ